VLRRISSAFPRAGQRIELLGLGGAALLLAVLSIYQLGQHSFWRDEVASVLFSSAPLSELLTVVGRDRDVADVPFMATYMVLLHFWLQFAETEAQIRFLSVLAGVATTVPVYFVARRLAGWPAGILAAAVFATAPYVIEWNQEARAYSLAMLTSATLTLLLLRAIERPTVLRWLLYGVVGAVGLYVHFFVGFILAAHAGYVLLTRSWPPLRPLVAAVVPLALAALPLPYLMLAYGGGYGWIPQLTLNGIRNTLAALAGGIPLLVAMAALGTVAVVTHRHDRRIWLILAAALMPIVVAILVSVFRPMLLGRYLVVSLPFIAILAGVGLSAIRPVVARAAVIGALGVLVAVAVPTAYKDDHQQDWRSAGAWIADAARPGDEVIVTPWGLQALDYYMTRADAGAVPDSTGIREALRDPPDRLWLVMANLSRRDRREVVDELRPRFEPAEVRQFATKVTVVLMTPRE
jgi:mannosyltransferase